MKPANPPVVARLLAAFEQRKPIRATSLIVTVFGDVVAQHGGSLWLGSLVRLLGPLGVDERLVRTSVFRLVKDGWLEATRIGRRSYYRFSDYGLHEYERAARRIYALEDLRWDGSWLLLMPLALSDAERERLRRSLHWQGFRSLVPGTYAKPGSGRRALREALDEFDVRDRVLVISGSIDELVPEALVVDTVREAWHLDQLATAYREFIARYRVLTAILRRPASLGADAALLLRILLIHDFRRILLQDTDLPEALLPRHWPGAEARALTAALYHRLAAPSQQAIASLLENESGSLPAADTAATARFA